MVANVAKGIRSQGLAVLALVVALGGVGAAATGQFARLGTANVADRTTAFINTGGGPALRLQNSEGPPFLVNSEAQVPKLNASLLGGRAPGAFLSSAGSQVVAVDGARESGKLLYRRSFVAPGNGVMRVSVVGMCKVSDSNRARFTIFLNGHNSIGTEIGAGFPAVDLVEIGCTATSFVMVTSGERITVGVQFDALGDEEAFIPNSNMTFITSFDTLLPPQ